MKVQLSSAVRFMPPSRVYGLKGFLVWSEAGYDVLEDSEGKITFSPHKPVAVSKVLLVDEFVRLQNASDEAILGFCGKYGGLNCCGRHGWPLGRIPLPHAAFSERCEAHGRCRPKLLSARMNAESYDLWRGLANYFDAIRQLIYAVRTKAATTEEWRRLVSSPYYCEDLLSGYPDDPPFQGPLWDLPVSEQHRALASLMTSLMYVYNAHPRMRPDAVRWSLEIDPWSKSVLSHVCLDLVNFMTNPEDMKGICDHCGKTIQEGRLRATTRNQYCEEPECKRAGWRASKQNQQKRWKNPTRARLNRAKVQRL